MGSIMAPEVCTFMDASVSTFIVLKDVCMLLVTSVPIYIITDSKQLFDAMTKSQRTTERQLRIDILSARQSYKLFEISEMGLVKGDENPADCVSIALYLLLITQTNKTTVQ